MKVLILVIALTIAFCLAEEGFYSREGNEAFYAYHPSNARSRKFLGNLTLNETEETKVIFKSDLVELVNCTFSRNDSILSCSDNYDSISCKSDLNMTGLDELSFDLLGLALVNFNSTLSEGVIKYQLFPFEKINNTNSSAVEYDFRMDMDRVSLLSLYYSSEVTENGVRVKELDCFKKLVDLLDSAKDYSNIRLVNQLLEEEYTLLGKLFL